MLLEREGAGEEEEQALDDTEGVNERLPVGVRLARGLNEALNREREGDGVEVLVLACTVEDTVDVDDLRGVALEDLEGA